MPEGPELYKNSQFVNKVCKGLIFSGKIVKSAVSTKNPDVSFPTMCDYCITSESRGKETALILTSLSSHGDGNQTKRGNDFEKQRLRILFRFGMSGKFTFGAVKEMHKHAHLNFFTKEKPVMVLSFVDVRRYVGLIQLRLIWFFFSGMPWKIKVWASSGDPKKPGCLQSFMRLDKFLCMLNYVKLQASGPVQCNWEPRTQTCVWLQCCI